MTGSRRFSEECVLAPFELTLRAGWHWLRERDDPGRTRCWFPPLWRRFRSAWALQRRLRVVGLIQLMSLEASGQREQGNGPIEVFDGVGTRSLPHHDAAPRIKE